MKTAKQVDALITELKASGIPLAEAAWKVALACVGWSYVYSAWGAECTPAERRKRYRLCPSHTTIKTKCKAFDNGDCSGCQWYPDGQRTRCFDCRGFTDWILKQIGFDLYGDTCGAQWKHDANWASKGEIATMPAGVLCCLFVYKDGKWNHTGFGLNNETIECSSGVQHFTSRKAKWTHWGVPACIDGAIPTPTPTPTPEPTPSGHKTLRRGDKGPAVVELQTDLVRLGYDIGPCGIDGDFGRATKAAVEQLQLKHGMVVDGICGPKTWVAIDQDLAALDQPAPIITYTVTIPDLSMEDARKLCDQYPKALISEGSVAR